MKQNLLPNFITKIEFSGILKVVIMSIKYEVLKRPNDERSNQKCT